jgi:hypothetical protein
MKRMLVSLRSISKLLVLMLIIGIIPPLAIYSWDAYARSTSDVTRAIQLILHLENFYNGPLDGICGPQTLGAIEKYNQSVKMPAEIKCSSQFLQSLEDTARAIPENTSITQEHEHQEKDSGGDVITLSTRVTSLEETVKNTNSTLRSLIDSYSSELLSQFKSLASVGVSAYATALSIFIAFAALMGNLFIKDRVKEIHEEERKKASETFSLMMETFSHKVGIAGVEVGTDIFAILGGHCLDLYKDFPEPGGRHNKVYKSYISMAESISAHGQEYGQLLRGLLDKEDREAITTQDVQKRARLERKIAVCLNNYVFYAAHNGDKVAVESVIDDLVKIASDKKAKGDPEWYSYEDTLIWARLHIGRYTAKDASEALQRLLDIPDISLQWKKAALERYELYNIFHPDDKVTVSV